MELNNKITEIIQNLNVDLNEIDNAGINLLTNQVFSIFYQVDENTDYSSIYSAIINIITKTKHNDNVLENFQKFRHKINKLNEVREEHYKIIH